MKLISTIEIVMVLILGDTHHQHTAASSDEQRDGEAPSPTGLEGAARQNGTGSHRNADDDERGVHAGVPG
jgi:hypothetical protein